MYRPDKFVNTFKDEGGQALWDFLNEPDNVLRMTTASYLGHPAVEPLSPALLQRFGPSIKRMRLKQMIGHMVRQVLDGPVAELCRSFNRVLCAKGERQSFGDR